MKNGDDMVKNKFNLKKIFSFAIILFAVCLLCCGCGEQANQSVEVDGILISKKNLYMAEGQTAVISAQVYPFNASNQNYTFESSDPEVVSIDDGFVVAKKAGDAVIYVVSEEGGYEDSCNVLVTTVKTNLEINDFNNLNMPPEELEPIYNSDDFAESSKAQTYSATQNRATKNGNKNNYVANKINKNSIKNVENLQKNSKKSSNILDFSKNLVKQVNAEVTEDVEETKSFFNDFKTELLSSINSISSQKEMLNSLWTETQSSMFSAFNNLQNDFLDSMEKFQRDLLTEIEDVENKVEAGEYTVESKELNGVSFVVIKNAE